jgi:hypothetical protein
MTQAAQSIGATKLIFGNVQPVGTDAYLITLKLLDAERGVVETWISEQLTKAQSAPISLRAPVQKWFATLTGQAQPATLKVVGGVVGAGVWIDGAQAGLLGADGLTLAGIASGPHQVAVSKSGYEKWERSVTLASGATEKVSVELKAIDGAGAAPVTPPAPEAAAVPLADAPAGGEADAVEPYNQGSRVAAWAILGVGLVSVGLGVYSGVKVGIINSNLDSYRRFPCKAGGNNCTADGNFPLPALDTKDIDYVNSQRSSGDTYSKLQWVGYGIGGALLFTSSVFFYRGYISKPTDVAARKSRNNLIVLPSFAPNSVGARAYLAF